jgi:hypothetical protein
MKSLKYQLSEGNCLIEIPIDPENPDFRILEVIENIPNPHKKWGNAAQLTLHYDRLNGKKESNTMSFGFGLFTSKDRQMLEQFNRNDNSIQKIILELKIDEGWEDLSIDLEIELGRSLINMTKPWQEFSHHISNPTNSKIFFSAPFGQGKTTFLNEFFRQQSKDYEVFRIFPVNYSVATNQDIFRYIKTDILFELVVDKNITFEKLEVSYLETIPTFVKKNADRILAPFLMLIPEVGKNLFAFYEKMKTVTDSFVEVHDKESAGDKTEVDVFLQGLFEQEGSIYEDNLITQIIRQQIKSIKEKTKKKTVLIIDDLDRLDPEHTFRILNIISAHYDSRNGDNLLADYNKFGFDRIIVVCDIENIKNIFLHRYGTHANFSGYINKFYSTTHFEYDNKKVMLDMIEALNDVQTRGGKALIYQASLNAIFYNLIENDQISLRNLIKLENCSLTEHIQYLDTRAAKGYYQFNRGICTPVISLLSDFFGENSLLNMIQNCKEDRRIISARILKASCWNLMASIANDTDNDNASSPFTVTVKSTSYEIYLTEHDYTGRILVKSASIFSTNIDLLTHQFSMEDFYELLLKNVKRYFQMRKSLDLNK